MLYSELSLNGPYRRVKNKREWCVASRRPGGTRWDLIINGLAHRGANGAAMPTDDDDQDGRFFLTTPRWGLLFRLGCDIGARSLCFRAPPSLGGIGSKKG